MDEQLFHEKVKALFPQAVAISSSCGIQTDNDGEDFATWSCSAYATPISAEETVKIAFGYGYSEAAALADMVEDAKRRDPSWACPIVAKLTVVRGRRLCTNPV